MKPRFRAIVIAIAVVSALRIASTWMVFSQVMDEPIHVATGWEWLAKGEYKLDREHPPLARLGFGLAPWLAHVAIPKDLDWVQQGDYLLLRGGNYRRNLAESRAPNLVFFLLALFTVAYWARRRFGDATGIVAAALFASLPVVLAHSGLATTDMAGTAGILFALYRLDVWLDESTRRNAVWLGVALGIALASKFSTLVFFPAGAICLLIPRVRTMRWLQALGAFAIAVLIVWACYRFTVGTVNEARIETLPFDSTKHTAAVAASHPGYEWVRSDLIDRYRAYAGMAARQGHTGLDFVDWAKVAGFPSPLAGRHGNTMRGAPPLPPVPIKDRLLEPFRAVTNWVARTVPVPAPAYVAGAEYVQYHSAGGHPAFLFGEHRSDGWWYYFPVLLFFKTPLPFLALALGGTALLLARRKSIGLALAPFAMLLPVLPTGINIGVRHVLPLYPLFAIVAACAAVELWRRSRVVTVLLVAWLFVGVAIAHPDYLPWFNECARHPEQIANDSNLDWGQDLLRLQKIVRKEHISSIWVDYFGSAPVQTFIPQMRDLYPYHPVDGWVAVSEMEICCLGDGRGYGWLEPYTPVRRAGKSIRLYFIAPRSAPSPSRSPSP